MGAGRFVGRVGALAVALGVGAAVSSGTAWADDAAGGSPNSAGAASGSNDSGGATSGSNAASGSDAGGGTADSTSVSDSAAGSSEEDASDGTPSSVDESTEQDPDETAADPDASTDSPAEVRDDSTEQEDTSPAPTRTSTDESSASRDRTERSSDAAEVAEPTAVEADRSSARSSTGSETESDSSTADSEATAEAATVAAPQSVLVNTITPTPLAAPVTDTADTVAAAADSADEPTASTAQLAGAVAASLLGTGAPGDVPVDTPAEWVLLAAARRELADPEDSSDQTATGSVATLALPTAAAPDPVGDILTGAFQTITGILSTAVSVADGTITGALNLIGGTINLAATATTMVLNTAINVVNWGITTTANLITGALATAVNALADAFDSSPTPLGDAIAGTLTFLNNVVTTTVNVLTQASTDVLSFTATGLSTAVTLLSDTIVGTLNLATQAVDLALQTINTILNPNSAPVAADDVASTAEDAAVLILAADLLANDTDPDGDTLSISALTQAVHGTTSKAANGDITYTPNTNFNGTDTFTYTISDGALTSTATVTVTVTPVNDAPVGVNDTASTTEDNPVTITLDTLLANDSDPEDDPFSITAVGQGTRGTTGRAANGDIIYTPGLNVSGTDTFTYTISDGDKSSTATVTVTITPTNDAPIAGSDTATTAEDTPKTITATTLLANDSDPDHDALSITAAGQGIHGTTSKAANGDITYSPNANFNGTDTFTYTITDGAKTSTATVTVTVTPVNDAPAGINDTASTTQGLAVTLAANTLLANDTDVDTAHTALSITAATQGTHGTTSRAANGDITYTPNPTFSGTDTFTYTVSDGALSSTATVTVTVTGTTPIEHSPVANNDNATTAEDTPKTITANTLLANDTDADNDPLSVTAATQGAHGTTSKAANGDITYTPNANFNGTDTFTYTITDGALTSTATVTVTITPVNDAPTGGSSNPGSPNTSTGVVIGTVNATDPDGDTLTYSAPTTTAKGSITMSGNTFTYTPTATARTAAGATGATQADKQDTFTVTADDGHGKTLAIPVTVTIAPPADAPSGITAHVLTNDATSGVITGYVTATDPNENTLHYSVTADPTRGKIILADDGTFTYTPTAAARLIAAQSPTADHDTVTITANDGELSAAATVEIPITPGHFTVSPIAIPASTRDGQTIAANPVSVAISPDGTRAYVVDGRNEKVSIIDTATNQVINSIDINIDTETWRGQPAGIAVSPDGTRAYVTDQRHPFLTVINTATATVLGSPINLGGGPHDGLTVSPDGTRIYLPSPSGGAYPSVVLVDATTNTVVNNQFFRSTTSNNQGNIVVSPDGTRIYIADGTTVAVVDSATRVVSRINTNTDLEGPLALSADGSRLFAVARDPDNTDAGAVLAIDTTSKEIVGTAHDIAYGALGWARDGELAVSADGSLVYDATPYGVVMIDVATTTVIGTPVQGNYGVSIAVSPNSNRAYVVTTGQNGGAGEISAITMDSVAVNSAPTAGPLTVGDPEAAAIGGLATQGKVTGTVKFSDANGDTLTYSLSATAKGGTVHYDDATDTFTYIPTQAARAQAASANATDADKHDTFTITADDGHAGVTTVLVTVGVAPGTANNRAPVVGPLTILTQDPETGTITGTWSVTDPDGQPLTYSVIPGYGNVDPDAHTFIYRPTVAERLHAAETPGADTLTFVPLIASDGELSVDVPITGPILPARLTVDPTPIAIGGHPTDIAVDSYRVYVSVPVTDASGVVKTFWITNKTLVDSAATLGGSPISIGLDSGDVYVASADGTIYVTSADGNRGGTEGAQADSTPGEIGVAAVYEHGQTVIVTEPAAGTLQIFRGDLWTNAADAVTNTIEIPGGSPTSLALREKLVPGTLANQLVFVGVRSTTSAPSSVAVLNTNLTSVANYIKIPSGYPTDIVFHSVDRAYVSVDDGGSGQLLKVGTDFANQRILGTATLVGHSPSAVEVSWDGTVALVVTSAGVEMVDTGTMTTIGAPIAVSAGTVGITKDIWTHSYSSAQFFTLNTIAGTASVINLTPVNSAPFAYAPAVGTPDPVTGIVTGSVTAVDADNDAITFSGSATTSKGSVEVTSTGAFTYTPTDAARAAAGASSADTLAKQDTFSIIADDGHGGIQPIPVTVSIAPPFNHPPVQGSANPGTPNSTTGVVTGTVSAADADGDTLTYSAPTVTAKGSITMAGNTFTYTPTAAARQAAAAAGATTAVKQDTFTVTADDGHGGTLPIPVTVTISPAVNRPPTDALTSVGVPDSTTGVVTGNVVAYDPDGDPVTYTGPTTTGKGAVVIDAVTGDFTYTPTADARSQAGSPDALVADRQDIFTVTATDPAGANLPVTVTVPVAPPAPSDNHAPVAHPSVGTPDINGAVDGGLHATDADGDTLTYSVSEDAIGGHVTVAADGSFAYTPRSDARYVAAATLGDDVDTFTSAVSDGHGNVTIAKVTVPVKPLTDPDNTKPTLVSVNVADPDPFSGVVTGTVRATDPDGDTLQYLGSGQGPLGTLIVESDGSFIFTPGAEARQYAADHSTKTYGALLTITVTDGRGGTLAAPVVAGIAPAMPFTFADNLTDFANYSASNPSNNITALTVTDFVNYVIEPRGGSGSNIYGLSIDITHAFYLDGKDAVECGCGARDSSWDYEVYTVEYTGAADLVLDSVLNTWVNPDIYMLTTLGSGDFDEQHVIGYLKLDPNVAQLAVQDLRGTDGDRGVYFVAVVPGTFPTYLFGADATQDSGGISDIYDPNHGKTDLDYQVQDFTKIRNAQAEMQHRFAAFNFGVTFANNLFIYVVPELEGAGIGLKSVAIADKMLTTGEVTQEKEIIPKTLEFGLTTARDQVHEGTENPYIKAATADFSEQQGLVEVLPPMPENNDPILVDETD